MAKRISNAQYEAMAGAFPAVAEEIESLWKSYWLSMKADPNAVVFRQYIGGRLDGVQETMAILGHGDYSGFIESASNKIEREVKGCKEEQKKQ